MATLVSNILTAVGYRLFPDGTTISATTEPSQAECIQWINETCRELLTVCVELGSELGRTSATITTVDGTAAYTDLAALLFSPVMYRDKDGAEFSAWIVKTNERRPLKLVREQNIVEYSPAATAEQEPTCFYINGSNGIVFIPTPDDEYTVIMPYYPYHTALTLTTNTIPFMQIFDDVITEAVVMRAQNREEYDLGYELRWFQYVRGQARKIIAIRKNPKTKITV